MATESEGTAWAERAWLFMALCRQLGIDSGLITYTKGNASTPCYPSRDRRTPRRIQRPRVVWICAVLIDDQAYLFDARLGLEIPGPGGQGVATLEQALSDPSILERMNIPGLAPYSTSRASLLASPTKIGILIDSSPGYFSPKMRLLQRELAGEYRSILYSDPAEQRDHFIHVLGSRSRRDLALGGAAVRSRPGSSTTPSTSRRSRTRSSGSGPNSRSSTPGSSSSAAS